MLIFVVQCRISVRRFVRSSDACRPECCMHVHDLRNRCQTIALTNDRYRRRLDSLRVACPVPMDRDVWLLSTWAGGLSAVVCSDYNLLDAGDRPPIRLFFSRCSIFTARDTSTAFACVELNEDV